jgi:hypothetical protein
LLQNVSQERAGSARGGDENWSVVEVVCHLRDAEERNLERIRLMRSQANPLLAGYDQEQWAIERNYAAARLEHALAAFLKFRATTLNELLALSPQEWERPGQHSETGSITIINYVQHLVSHDAVHLAQIARQLQDVA